MAELVDFIHIYENNLDSGYCDYLIEFFNSSSNDKIFNLTDNREVTPELSKIHQALIKIVIDIRDKYYKFCDERVFPETHAFEKFNIIKILPEDQETTSVDILSYENARRFLSFRWDLNDNLSGHMKFLDLNIQPEKGKLIVYPPFWMFPHTETTPVEEPKYILTTYLHYK